MVQHMAKKIDPTKNVSFAAVVPGTYAVELDNYQWENRLTRPELVRLALDAFADANGIARPLADTATDGE